MRRNWHKDAFFGLHYDLHAGKHDTDLGKELTHEHLRTELQKVGPDFVQCDCKGHPGYASYPTQVGVPSPGIVQDALRIHREVTAELGIPLSVHYSGVWDSAAVANRPDWARVRPDGTKDENNTCLTSGYTAEYMIPQLLEIVKQYDVDGFWIDGENWASAPCYCDRCRSAYEQETGQTTAPTNRDEARWEEWLAFHRRAFDQHVRAYTQAVHDLKPECMVCSNWMYSVRQPEAITVPVDYLSGDFSHAYGAESALAEARFLDSRGLPWDLMAWTFTTGEPKHQGFTMKSAEHMYQEVAVVLACGGAVFLYNQPQRTGHLTGWHQDLMAHVAAFCRERRAASQHTVSVPQVAVLLSETHYYKSNSPLYNPGGAVDGVYGALISLLENHYHVDICNEETLATRLHEYAMVVIPEVTHLPQAWDERLEAYARSGGRLLLSGEFVAERWGELVGVEPTGAARVGYHYLPVAGEATTAAGPWQPVLPTIAEPLLPLLRQEEPSKDAAGTPAATIRRLGAGRVVAVHGPLFAHYHRTRYPRTRQLIGELCRSLDPQTAVRLHAPATVHCTLRRRENTHFIHLVNLGVKGPFARPNVMVEEVPVEGPILLEVMHRSRPRAVRLVPGHDTIHWTWADGVLRIELARVHIHSIVAIEGGRIGDVNAADPTHE